MDFMVQDVQKFNLKLLYMKIFYLFKFSPHIIKTSQAQSPAGNFIQIVKNLAKNLSSDSFKCRNFSKFRGSLFVILVLSSQTCIYLQLLFRLYHSLHKFEGTQLFLHLKNTKSCLFVYLTQDVVEQAHRIFILFSFFPSNEHKAEVDNDLKVHKK